MVFFAWHIQWQIITIASHHHPSRLGFHRYCQGGQSRYRDYIDMSSKEKLEGTAIIEVFALQQSRIMFASRSDVHVNLNDVVDINSSSGHYRPKD